MKLYYKPEQNMTYKTNPSDGTQTLVPSRPDEAKSLIWRLLAAWQVIRGKAGIFKWY
jgi:hypothetical protein